MELIAVTGSGGVKPGGQSWQLGITDFVQISHLVLVPSDSDEV